MKRRVSGKAVLKDGCEISSSSRWSFIKGATVVFERIDLIAVCFVLLFFSECTLAPQVKHI